MVRRVEIKIRKEVNIILSMSDDDKSEYYEDEPKRKKRQEKLV